MTNKQRVAALFARAQDLPRDDYHDARGHVLAHLFGALEAMAGGHGRCSLKHMLDAVERAIVSEEESVARRTGIVPREEVAANCPGYAGPAPEGVDYSDWLAMNNID